MVKYMHVGRPHGKSLARVRQRSPLLVGTDCSGIETPLLALKNLKVPMRHVFSCDNDPHVKKVILANFKPEVFFDDLTQRKLHNNTCLEKPLDLYVAGFPCQQFSAAGVHGGTSDPRGLIIVHILRFIQEHTPRTFLLENVKGLVSKKHRETFLAIMRCLCPDVSKCTDCRLPFNLGVRILLFIGLFTLPACRQLRGINDKSYHIHAKILCPSHHGIPHHRPRLFIVGILKTTTAARLCVAS